MFDIIRKFELIIELKDKVDYFNCILKIQADIRETFIYDNITNSIKIFSFSFGNLFYQGDKDKLSKSPTIKTFLEFYNKYGNDCEFDCYVCTFTKLLEYMKHYQLKEVTARIKNYQVDMSRNDKERYTIEYVEQKSLEEMFYIGKELDHLVLSKEDIGKKIKILTCSLLFGNIKRLYWKESLCYD